MKSHTVKTKSTFLGFLTSGILNLVSFFTVVLTGVAILENPIWPTVKIEISITLTFDVTNVQVKPLFIGFRQQRFQFLTLLTIKYEVL